MTRSRQWTLGAVAIVVVIALAGWFLLVQAERKHAASLNLQTAQQLKTNQGLEAQIAMLKAQSKKLPQMEASLAKVRTSIPVGSEMPQLIRQLTDAADASGVTLRSLMPADPVSVTPTSSETGGVVLPPGQLAIVNLKLEFDGNFFETEEFMSRLEKMPRAFLTSSLQLASGSETNQLHGVVQARVFFAPQELPVTPEIPGVTPAPVTSPAASSTAAPTTVQ